MNLKFKIEKLKLNGNNLLFILSFTILGYIALQIPINILAGSKVKFTLFDLFAPITGAFLGSGLGIVVVVLMQTFNLIVHGFKGIQTDSFLKLVATLRFLPLIFGVLYFALRRSAPQGKPQQRNLGSLILLIPLISIVAFNLHPIGRSVWFYSLFWLIPLIVWPLKDRFLLARALGSTFTAHAAGGAVWIWAFNLPATVWQSLIPVVILERSIFALGISASYILINNILEYLSSKKVLTLNVTIDKKYLLKTLNPKP